MWLRLAIAVSTERADLPKSGRFVQSESGHPTIPLPMLNCLVDGSHIDGKLALPTDLVQLAEQLARQWTPAGKSRPSSCMFAALWASHAFSRQGGFVR
jgi:hypothetical protein